MTFDELWTITGAIPGSFTRLNAEKLYEAALSATGVIVEVGVDQGRSASVLCAAAEQTGGAVMLVDSWESVLKDNVEKTRNHLDRWRGRFRILHMSSVEGAEEVKGALAMVHIDANHYDEHPGEDCALWLPKLVSGGLACFRDYGPVATFPAVTAAVDRFTEGWEHLGDWEALAIRRKP